MQRRELLTGSVVGTIGALAGCTLSEAILSRNAEVGWKRDFEEIEDVSIAGDHVYVAADSSVFAFDRSDGSLDWRSAAVQKPRLELDGPNCYVHGDGGLVALDRSSGDRRWGLNDSSYSVVRGEDVLLVNGSSGDTIAVDPETGSRRWKKAIGSVDGLRTNLAVTTGRAITAIDFDDGTQRWRFDDGTGRTILAIDEGCLYLTVDTDDGQYVTAIERNDGTERWRRPVTSDVRYTGELRGGTLYVTGMTDPTDGGAGVVVALEPETGALRWRRTFGKELWPAYPAGWLDDGDGVFLVWGNAPTEGDGRVRSVRGLDPRDGTSRWERTERSVVTTTDDLVVLEVDGGSFEGVSPSGETQWRDGLEFVPRVGVAGNDPVYYSPEIAVSKETFVAGFEGTNVLSERTVEDGSKTWELRTEEVFETIHRGSEDDLYVSTDEWISGIRIS